jgi:hypothetical protein
LESVSSASLNVSPSITFSTFPGNGLAWTQGEQMRVAMKIEKAKAVLRMRNLGLTRFGVME